MLMYKRYEGSFLTRKNETIRCEIWQEANSAFAQVGDLDFAGDNPVVIEWHEHAKHEPICGSTATIILESPGDRTYNDLFTVRPGTIRLDVYRAGSLYWSGLLDPETAEEPYTAGKNYYVNLTFSDLGILKRLKYNMTGMQTFSDILSDALLRSGINYGSLDTGFISSTLGHDIRALPANIKVLSDNFYDEEGAPMSLYDALEGIMQPLAQRMIQRGGRIVLYDLNGLYAGATPQQIAWASNGQVLSVDRVYNEAKVTFSPYAKDNLFPEFEYTGSKSLTDVQNDAGGSAEDSAVIYPDYNTGGDATDRSFAMVWSDESAKGLAAKLSSAKYFRMIPILGGKDLSGVALWFYTQRQQRSTISPLTREGALPCPGASAEILRTEATFLPKLSQADASNCLIRICQGILFDTRYNPFTEATRYNEKWAYNEIQDKKEINARVRLICVPVKIELKDAPNGNVLYYYSNETYRYDIDAGYATPGSGVWVRRSQGTSTPDNACELFYEYPYKEDSNGFLGNRQARNLLRKPLSAALEAADPGEYIPYPPAAGYLVVTVLAGVKFYSFSGIHDYWYIVRSGGGDNYCNPSYYTSLAVMDDSEHRYFRWILFEAPELEVVKSDLTGTIDNEDVEYSGTINPDAEESLEISEICGSMSPVSPAARGLLYKGDGEVLSEMTRADRTNSPEQLLIGTMLSHHADRMDVLSGTAELWSGFTLLTDAALPADTTQPRKKLLPVSIVERLREEEMEIRAVETVADDYITEEESV